MVKVLIEKGADVNAKNKWDDSTPLRHAAGNGYSEIVTILQEAKKAEAKGIKLTRRPLP